MINQIFEIVGKFKDFIQMQENETLDWRIYLQEWSQSNFITTPPHLVKIREEFNLLFPKENLSELKLTEYAVINPEGNPYNFCQFIKMASKFISKEVGIKFVHSNKRYGMYWDQEYNDWACDTFFQAETGEEAFQSIKTGLVELIQQVEEENLNFFPEGLDFIADKFLEKNRDVLRVMPLYLYYPDKLIPVFLESELNYFLNLFNIFHGLPKSGKALTKNIRLYKFLIDAFEKNSEFQKFDSWGMTRFLYDFKNNLDPISLKPDSQINQAWIFQSNPSLFDLRSALDELDQFTWLVKQNKDKIHSGDRVFFWESGNEAGILGTGKILSEPKMQEQNLKEKIFNIDDSKFEGEQFRVLIEVENFFKNPILRKELLKYPEISNLSILRHSQGTNFSVTNEEAECIENLIREHEEAEFIEDLIREYSYTWEDFKSETFYDSDFLERLIRTIERKKQIILTGCPGSGKTYLANKLAQYLTSETDGLIDIIQFHPAYTYEDFMQGLRPITDEQNNLTYKVVSGRFLEFCEQARNHQGNCVLIIDEINRANLAAVFGELMYLLEYRDLQIKLAGSREPFSIPKNVYLIGTMNTADRSIALVDHALRRRFAFIELRPDYHILHKWHQQKQTGFEIEGLIQVLNKVNDAIGNPHYHIGISFFLDENLVENINDIWELEILPYLEEIFYDSLDKYQAFTWEKIQNEVLNNSK